MLIFNAPKNFKRGQYIFGKYRVTDIVCILGITILCVLGIVTFLNVVSSKNILINLIAVMIFLLPVAAVYIIYMPMPTYFNVLEYIRAFIFFHRKQKSYKWEGIHQFEKGEEYEKAK